MKPSRLLTSILTFLLIINFFRVINGAGFLGSSEVLDRLDEFEFDLEPVYNLVALWQDNNYGNVSPVDASDYESLDSSSDGFSSDSGIMPIPSYGGGTSFDDYFPNSSVPADASWIEKVIHTIGSMIQQGYETTKSILSGVLDVSSGLPVIGDIVTAVSKKINLLSDTISFLWNNGLSLLLLPIQLISQTLSFSFWLLGFSG